MKASMWKGRLLTTQCLKGDHADCMAKISRGRGARKSGSRYWYCECPCHAVGDPMSNHVTVESRPAWLARLAEHMATRIGWIDRPARYHKGVPV